MKVNMFLLIFNKSLFFLKKIKGILKLKTFRPKTFSDQFVTKMRPTFQSVSYICKRESISLSYIMIRVLLGMIRDTGHGILDYNSGLKLKRLKLKSCGLKTLQKHPSRIYHIPVLPSQERLYVQISALHASGTGLHAGPCQVRRNDQAAAVFQPA